MIIILESAETPTGWRERYILADLAYYAGTDESIVEKNDNAVAFPSNKWHLP